LTNAYSCTVFAAFNLLFIPVVYFLYPETANRTLEDIDEYFDVDSGHTTIIPFGDKATKSTARPQEAIDAEIRRVTVADKKVTAQKSSAVHVEQMDELDN
jgi:Sugar (and other) transporter